jgi:hypothetical protein
MSAFLVRKASDLGEGTKMERFTFGILMIWRFFANVVTRSDGFGVVGAVGSFHTKAQGYFLQLIWNALSEHLEDVYEAIAVYHPDVRTDNIRPYMLKSATPNVFAFFHLSFQSIKQDFVHPFLLH